MNNKHNINWWRVNYRCCQRPMVMFCFKQTMVLRCSRCGAIRDMAAEAATVGERPSALVRGPF